MQQTPVVSKEENVSNEYEGPNKSDVAANPMCEYGLYMCCVACMIDAGMLPANRCDSSPSHVKEEENKERTRKCVCVCVLSRYDFPNITCICIL